MKNLGRNLLSMGLMLAMAFNCANVGKCLELKYGHKLLELFGVKKETSEYAAKADNGRERDKEKWIGFSDGSGLIGTGGIFSPEKQKEILNLIVYAGVIKRSEVRDRDSLEKDMFGRVLSENERLGKLYYLEGLKAQYGPELLELCGVKKEVRDIIKANNFKKTGPTRAEKCGYAAEDSFSKAGPVKSGPERARRE